MSSAYGVINKSAADDTELIKVLPARHQLKNGEELLIIRLRLPMAMTIPLFCAMKDMLNIEIQRGNTYPQEQTMNDEAFAAYFLGSDAFIALIGEGGDVYSLSDADINKRLAGMFYIKPNFPGRSNHICNGGFVTASQHRGKGVGIAMAKTFVEIVPLLGYRASMFNLVYSNNEPSIRLWQQLKFREIGRVPLAGRLQRAKSTPSDNCDQEEFVDAIIFYRDYSKKSQSPTSKL